MVRRKSSPTRSRPASGSKGGQKTGRANVAGRNNRVKSGVIALQEIRFLRKTTKLIIPKLPFSRLVREIMHELFPRSEIFRMQVTALEALQEATEMYLVQFFEDSILLAYHSKRITLMQRDMILMRRLRGRDDVINR
ncbi:GSCOCG00008261001-RA-CDS [Cotesia congregata]|nr:GSCOCG00008261001-RA-CDS [Cotesia congregata]